MHPTQIAIASLLKESEKNLASAQKLHRQLKVVMRYSRPNAGRKAPRQTPTAKIAKRPVALHDY